MSPGKYMKILFIDFTLPYLLKDEQYPIGGWAIELHTWLKGLNEHGIQLGIITWKGASRYVNQKLDYCLLETYDPKKGIPIIKYFYYYMPTIFAAVKKFSPDIIIQSCSGLQTGIMAFIAKLLNIPFVYRAASDRDSDRRYKKNLPWYASIAYRYGLKNASIILAQNNYQYQNFKKKYINSSIHIIHNPFDVNNSVPYLNHREKRKYIAWLGVFKHAKNIPLLYEIAKKLPQIPFHIAGMPSKTIDSETALTLKLLRQLPNVNLVGYIRRKNIMQFLSKSVALLSTSHFEGFSNSFLEALFTGTPLIVPKRIDPDFIIRKHKLGLVANHDSELSSLILQIWNVNKKEYDNMVRRCHAYILTYHNYKLKANELKNILESYLINSYIKS